MTEFLTDFLFPLTEAFMSTMEALSHEIDEACKRESRMPNHPMIVAYSDSAIGFHGRECRVREAAIPTLSPLVDRNHGDDQIGKLMHCFKTPF
jgi:hypothetical protein